MPRPPFLFDPATKTTPAAPDDMAEDLRAIEEHKNGILNFTGGGYNFHFNELHKLARRGACYDTVDKALEEIVQAERGRGFDKENGLTDVFIGAVGSRVSLLNRFPDANQARVESVIDDLIECGLKHVEHQPESFAQEFAVRGLKDVAHHHPKASERVSRALAVLAPPET
jgi:hypothetical protein